MDFIRNLSPNSARELLRWIMKAYARDCIVPNTIEPNGDQKILDETKTNVEEVTEQLTGFIENVVTEMRSGELDVFETEPMSWLYEHGYVPDSCRPNHSEEVKLQ